MPYENLIHFKSFFAHHFFVVPADRNYLLARFARVFGMGEEFWWQAAQAVEKYLKAGLVLNSVKVKHMGHDLKVLWRAHREAFGDCAVTALRKPDELNEDRWTRQTLEDFLRSVGQLGNPDTRYGLVGYEDRPDDLFRLDQLVFELRRRTMGLNWVVGEAWQDENLREHYGQTYRAVIELRPKLQIRQVKLHAGEFARAGRNFRDLFYAWNYAFGPAPEDLKRPVPATVSVGRRTFSPFRNSELYLLWQQVDDGDLPPAEVEGVFWLLDHVRIGKGSEKKFRDAMSLHGFTARTDT